MSSGTNSERIIQNNGLISDNNSAIDNFTTSINNLPTGVDLQDKNVTINQNGVQTLNADTGYDGLGTVQITTSVPTNVATSYAQMITSFNSRSYPYTGWLNKVVDWTKKSEIGDYQVDLPNSRIVISNTTLLEIIGSTGGYGYGEINYDLVDTNGNSVLTDYSTKMLYQFGGNFYWRANLQTCIVELDATKTYYLSLYAKGYNNKDFNMNDGFGASSTWISAYKLA